MSFNFEKGIEVSPQIIESFIDDMVKNIMISLPREQFFNVCAKYNFTFNSNNQKIDIDFPAKYAIMNYYILAMNKYFSFDEISITQYQNFVNMASQEISTGKISTQNMLCSLIRILFQFTTPLYNFFQAYPLGNDRDIDNHLSLLPPIIRYYVLSDLYDQIAVKLVTGEPIDVNQATAVVDKLTLVIIKISDSQTAFNWLTENFDLLVHLGVYNACMSKVHIFANHTTDYTTFSEALPFHDKNWGLACDTDARRIFTYIVDFYYNSSSHAALLLASDL